MPHTVCKDLDADLSGILPDSLCSSYRSGRSALCRNVQLAVAVFSHADISRKCSRGKITMCDTSKGESLFLAV